MLLRIIDSRLNEDDEVKIEPAANLQQESIMDSGRHRLNENNRYLNNDDYNLLFLPKLNQSSLRIFNPNKLSKFTNLFFLFKRYTNLFKMLNSLM